MENHKNGLDDISDNGSSNSKNGLEYILDKGSSNDNQILRNNKVLDINNLNDESHRSTAKFKKYMNDKSEHSERSTKSD